jgi:heme/copper-type cytochrome/quinol oxidase subunit 3
MSALVEIDPRRDAPLATFATAMLVFVEVMFFAGLASAFVVLRSAYVNWPPVGQPQLPILVSTVNTLILMGSGVLTLSWRSALSRPPVIARALSATLALGVLFVAIQGAEWARLIRAGLSTDSVYGALFSTIVGAHALHVAAGLVALGLFAARARAGELSAASWDGVRALRTYWLFVVLLWPALYALVYLW